MTSIEERLGTHLDAVANYVASPDDGPAELIRHARRRQFRRRRIAMMSSALFLIAATVGVLQLTTNRSGDTVKVTGSDERTESGDDQGSAPSLDTASTIAPDPAVSRPAASDIAATPSTLTWSVRSDVIPVSGERARSTDGTFYAIGTAPVAGSSSEAVGFTEGVFRSTDGLDWVRAPEDDHRIGGIWSGNIDDLRLYQVGTAAKTAPITPSSPGGDLIIRIDNLETAASAEAVLPGPDLRELSKLSKVDFFPGPVASGPLGVVATVSVSLVMPPRAGDVIPPEFERFVRGDVQLYLSTDRETFEAVDLPPVATTRSIVGALADADGFTVITSSPIREKSSAATAEPFVADAAIATEGSTIGTFSTIAIATGSQGPAETPAPNFRITLYSSPDGRIWTEGPSTSIPASPNQATRVDGRIVVNGYGMNAAVVASTNGVTWDSAANIPMRDLSTDGLPLTGDFADFRYVHEDGVAVLRDGRVDPVRANGGVSFARNGYTFKVLNEQLGVTVVEDVTGEALGSLPNPVGGGRIQGRGDGFAILASDGTDDLAMTHDEFFSLAQEAVGTVIQPGEVGECRCEVLYSSDAAAWSSVDVAAVVGEPVARVMWAGRTANGWAMNVQLVRRQPNGEVIIEVLEGR